MPGLDPGRLVCTGGELYAHVFENQRADTERQLFWCLCLECRSIRWKQKERDVCLLIEWLTWPVRNWRELDGMSLAEVLSPESVEASFYFLEHNKVRLDELTLGRVVGASIDVVACGAFDLVGFDEFDGEDLEFRIQGTVRFPGVYVIPDELDPKPTTPAEVERTVRDFIDTDDLEAPVWEQGFRFVLAPRADAEPT